MADWPELFAAYGLNHRPCAAKCKRLCKTNPYCLCHLGNEKWPKLVSVAEQKRKDGLYLPRNVSSEPVGLINEGNTCYMNSLLQLWFNDADFRAAVYDWKSINDWVKTDEVMIDVQDVMNELKRLFVEMEITPFDETTPKNLASVLGLNTEQQDAQEFNQLFLDTLEEALKTHPNGHDMLSVLSNHKGRCVNLTKCVFCGYESRSEEPFRELPISIEGEKSLVDALEGHFEAEYIDEWLCDDCKKKGGNRFVRLKEIGEVLVIRLNRFSYDKKTWEKKKNSNGLSYARKIDVGQYLEEKPARSPGDYHLSAILVHQGPSAHAGHYYALIQEPRSGKWYKFNDNHVELLTEKRIPGTDLADDKLRTSAEGKGAYMLVYRSKKSLNQQRANVTVPPKEMLETLGVSLTSDFDSGSRNSQKMLCMELKSVKIRSKRVNELWTNLRVSGVKKPDDRGQLAFLPTKLLSDLQKVELDSAQKVIDTDTDDLSESEADLYLKEADDPVKLKDSRIELELCCHKKLSCAKVLKGDWRAVLLNGAEMVYQRYKLGTVLFECSYLCQECLEVKLIQPHLKSQLDEYVAEFNAEAKDAGKVKLEDLSDDERPHWHYVEKSCVRSWKKLASAVRIDPKSGIMVNFFNDEPFSKCPRTETDEENNGRHFNKDLICPHGNLDPGAPYLLVNENMWHILREYFPDCPDFSAASDLCPTCLDDLQAEDVIIEQRVVVADEFRRNLSSLFRDWNNREFDTFLSKHQDQPIVLVCKLFMESLDQFIRAPRKYEIPTIICNRCIVCEEHKRLLFPVATTEDDFESDIEQRTFPVVPITDDEWLFLAGNQLAPVSIDDANYHFIMNYERDHWVPEFCADCYEKYVQEQDFAYKKSEVIIYKVDDSTSAPFTLPSAGVRRSRRRVTPRDSLKIPVSCDTTLVQIKLAAMEYYHYSPVDMHFYLKGNELGDGSEQCNQLTLQELRVPANATILLKFDPIKSHKEVMADSIKEHSRRPESGFKDTNLGSSKCQQK